MQKALLFVIALGTTVGLMVPNGRSTSTATEPPPAKPSREVFERRPVHFATTLTRKSDGHFYVHANVNGQVVRFLVDTGATSVALTEEDAKRVGLAFSASEFDVIGRGASGDVRGKLVKLDRVDIEGKEVRDVRGAVLEGADVSLLGQSYLSRIGSVQMSGDQMTLR